MNLRSNKQVKTVSVALGVAAAEVASYLYYLFTPWFLSPGDRSLYTSAVFNVVLFVLLKAIVDKYWYLRSTKDAAMLSAWLTALYICFQGPYVITWYNPLSYMYLLGPAAHTLTISTAMTGVLFYFKNK